MRSLRAWLSHMAAFKKILPGSTPSLMRNIDPTMGHPGQGNCFSGTVCATRTTMRVPWSRDIFHFHVKFYDIIVLINRIKLFPLQFCLGTVHFKNVEKIRKLGK